MDKIQQQIKAKYCEKDYMAENLKLENKIDAEKLKLEELSESIKILKKQLFQRYGKNFSSFYWYQKNSRINLHKRILKQYNTPIAKM